MALFEAFILSSFSLVHICQKKKIVCKITARIKCKLRPLAILKKITHFNSLKSKLSSTLLNSHSFHFGVKYFERNAVLFWEFNNVVAAIKEVTPAILATHVLCTPPLCSHKYNKKYLLILLPLILEALWLA